MYNNVYLTAPKRTSYDQGWCDNRDGKPFTRPTDKKLIKPYRNGWKDFEKVPVFRLETEREFA
jgi:hypothetical protein